MKATLQTAAVLLLVALLAGAAGWWLGRRPDPRLVAQLDTLRTANPQLDSAVQVYRAAGPAADTVIVRARAAAAVHDTVTVRLIDSVLTVAPDTLLPILTRARAAHVATVAELTLALDSLTAERDRAKALLARAEALRAANLALAQACMQGARPGLLGRALRVLPWVAGAYVVGRLAR